MTALGTRGVSPTGSFVEQQIRKQWHSLHESDALGNESLCHTELTDLCEECSQPDWDGSGARPVTRDAYEAAERFLLALPLGTARPSLGAEPDGDITFEWHTAPRRTLSVSISPTDQLHYAALVGPNKESGTMPFFGEVPKSILEIIREVTRRT